MNRVQKAYSAVTKFLVSSGGSRNGGGSFFRSLQNPSDYTLSEVIENLKGTAFTCATIRAERVRRVDWKSVKNGEEVENSPLIDFLNNPNESLFLTRQKLIEMTDISYSYTGEAFWLLEKGKNSKIPMRIWPARPDRMELGRNEFGEITGFIFTNDKGVRIPFDRDEVVFFRTANPSNIYRGIGRVQAAIDSIQTEDELKKYTKRFIHNDATPGGLVTIKGAQSPIDKDEFNEVKRKWHKEHGGTDNAGRIAFAREADFTFTKLGSGLNELQPDILLKTTKEDIMEAFQVPEQLMGKHNNSGLNNSGEAHRFFKDNVVMPIAEDYTSMINMTLGKSFDESLEIKNESDLRFDELLEDVKSKLNAETGYMSLNQYLAEHGKPLIDDESADMIYRPTSVMPSITVERPEDPTQQKSLGTTKVTVKKKRTKSLDNKVLKVSERKDIIWKTLDRIDMNYSRNFEKAVQGLRKDQEERLLERIRNEASIEQAFDLAEETKTWTNRLFPIYLAIADAQQQATSDFIGLKDEGSLIDRKDMLHLRQRAKRFAKGTNERVYDEIKNITSKVALSQKALTKGVTEEQVIEIKDYYKKNEWQERRIARTESSKASNYMAIESYKESPYVTAKEWYANPGACEFCVGMNGKIIELDDSFSNLGSSVTGIDGGILRTDFETVTGPPLHPNCRCRAIPWSRAFEDTGTFSMGDDIYNSASLSQFMPNEIREKLKEVKITQGESRFIEENGINVKTEGEHPRGVLAKYDKETKTIYIYDSTDVKLKHQVYHEFGHSIDRQFTPGRAQSDKVLNFMTEKEREEIVLRRIMRENDIDEAFARETFNNFKKSGGTSGVVDYMTSNNEVFADAYAQYKINPDIFSTYAPRLFAIFNGLFQ